MKKIWITIKKFFGWKPKVTPTLRNNFLEWNFEEQDLAAVINSVREDNIHNSMLGMKQIKVEELLWWEARRRCNAQIKKGVISHDGVGATFEVITGGGFKYPAEILASGYTSAEAVVQAWLNSPSHKKIILNPLHTYFGVGVLKNNGKYYYCVLFAR